MSRSGTDTRSDTADEVPELTRPRPRARVRYNAALRLVRRAHLYAGLFLLPWVFLYGVTALLFNHPGAFPDRKIVPLDASDLAGTPFEDFPGAPELASRIVGGLKPTERDGTTGPSFRLVHPEAARYSRELNATVADRGREHGLRIDLETRSGSAYSTLAGPTVQATWPGVKALDLPDSPRKRLAEGIPKVLAKLGHGAEVVTIKNPPEVVFEAESDGQLWRVSYNLQSGAITGQTMETHAEALSIRRFLTGLHLARGYPTRRDVRWLWAVSVDAMFATMVFWGISGLFMWWQLKATRRWGVVVLVASAVTATLLAINMHHVLAH
jgi:hypothetical protein